jgi:hypothetical protein
MGFTAKVVFALVLFGLLATLQAQVETARITGTITDPTGAAIPGARITTVHVQTGLTRVFESQPDGRYLTLPLRIGQYRLEVEAEGFKRAIREGIVLQLQEAPTIDFALEIGSIAESVQVTSDAPLLATLDASQGQVINNKAIVDMPLNGRNYIQLALLSAGTVQPIGGRFGGFSAGGQRTVQNNYMLDGIDNNNVQLAAQGQQAETVQPSVDAIQEFRISTNAYSAEFGRAAGGVINATIKSGTNEIHGTAFEFIRNEKLDAKNFFDLPDQPRPAFKRNQYGFSIGGPIVKNRVFLFGDYEWTKVRESLTVNNTIPSIAQRGGDFSNLSAIIYDPATFTASPRGRQPFAGNVIPSSRIDAVSARAASWYPTPQNANLVQNYLHNPPNQSDIDRWDLRADYNISSTDTLFYRISSQTQFSPASPPLPAPAFGSTSSDFSNTGWNMALVWSRVLTPSLVTTTRLGWNQLYTEQHPPIDRNVNAELGLRGVDQTRAGAPLFNINGVTNLGIGANLPNLNDSQTRQMINDTSWIKGSHTIKFGVNLSWLQAFITNPKEGLGVFLFNGVFTRNPANNAGGNPFADFLLGIPNQTDVADDVYSNLRAPFYHFYVQDEWRATRKLTLNIGLRYEYNANWVETRNLLSNFDVDLATPSIIVAQDGSRTSRALQATDRNNFAPRFGFAYSLTNKTVLRGGYGIFIGNYEGTGGGRFMLGNPPQTISVRLTTDQINPAFVLQDGVPAGTLDPRNTANVRLSSFVTNPKWPTSQQWNFNIQRELGNDMVMEVGYYAAKGNHLPTRWNGNFALPGPGNINARRRFTEVPFPGIDHVIRPLTIVDRHDWFGNSTFHSFQARLEKRFGRGFSFMNAYTFSKTIGDTVGFAGAGSASGDPQGFQNPLNRQLEKALDSQDMRHRFVSSYMYELPFGIGHRFGSSWSRGVDAFLGGWSIGGITTLTAGQPQGLTVQGDPANTGDPNRPNVVGDWRLSRSERTLQRFFNTSAFVRNDPFTYGNAGRNLMQTPGVVNFDFATFKRFVLTEKFALQFRFEAFNFFNTPAFGAPNSQVGNINFGQINSAGRPRNLQFGLKLIF